MAGTAATVGALGLQSVFPEKGWNGWNRGEAFPCKPLISGGLWGVPTVGRLAFEVGTRWERRWERVRVGVN